jgi:Right handed beta helix region
MKNLVIIIALFLNSILSFSQTNYYVSLSGNNFNSGTLSMPWQTLQYSIDQLTTNDTLNILEGIYTEKINITASNVYIRNYFSNNPVIDALGITTQNPILNINNKSNVTIEGLEIKNNIQTDAQGILIDGFGANIKIKNCKVHDIHFSSDVDAPVNSSTNAQGIIVYGTDENNAITNLKIQNNEIYNCRLGYSEGLAMNGNVDGFEITGNNVHDLTNIGIVIIGHEGNCPNPANDQARYGVIKNNVTHDCISAYATSGGIYVDGGKLSIIENNISYKNGYGIEIGCENIGKTTDGIVVRNNIIYNNEISGIALGGFDYPSGSGKVINTLITNNTLYYNDYSNSGNGELYLSYCENSIIENNIFFTSTQNTLAYADLSQPVLIFDYNTIYCEAGASELSAEWNGNALSGFEGFALGSQTNANSQFADPQFALQSITNPNFHLLSISPAINAGNPSFNSTLGENDLDGELRTNGIVDCGADEYYSTTGLYEDPSTNQYLLYPNLLSDNSILYCNKILTNATLLLYNSVGLKVKQIENISGNSILLQHSDLPSGLYFITLIEGNKIFKSKLVIAD